MVEKIVPKSETNTMIILIKMRYKSIEGGIILNCPRGQYMHGTGNVNTQHMSTREIFVHEVCECSLRWEFVIIITGIFIQCSSNSHLLSTYL